MKPEKPTSITVANLHGVGIRGDNRTTIMLPCHPMESAQALNLAAWLVALNFSDRNKAAFDDLLERILAL